MLLYAIVKQKSKDRKLKKKMKADFVLLKDTYSDAGSVLQLERKVIPNDCKFTFDSINATVQA